MRQIKPFQNIFLHFLLGVMLLSIFPVNLFASDRIGPTAILSVSPSSGSIFTTFSFDASKSTDSRGYNRNLEYRFNFEYGAATFTDWDTRNKVSYRYTTASEKKVILEIRDRENGYTDRTFVTLNVSDDFDFNASFSVTPGKGDTNTAFVFQAEITSTLSIPVTDYEVRFDFDGDNDWDTNFLTQHTAYHSFSEVGFYTPKIEVRDPFGNIITILELDPDNEELLGEDRENMILVSRSGVPQASLSVFPSVGISDETIFYFNAQDSFDYEDIRDLNYRFDFQNDGIFDTEVSKEPIAQTRYNSPGVYTIMVQVIDSSGLTDEAFTTIEVRENDMAPEADFSIRSDSQLSSSEIGTVSTIFTFNASRSRDNEDSASYLQIRFDFESDGIFDTPFSTEKTVQHRFLETGVKEVTLEVLDSASNISSVTKKITIIENTAPYASLSITPLRGTPATVFHIDPTGSRDNQYRNSSLRVRFDFDGDLEFDTDFENIHTLRKSFLTPGVRVITMQVRDPEGQVSESSQSIEILENALPQASLTVSPYDGTFSTTFTLDASASYDNQPTSGELKYRFDFDYTGDNDVQYDTSFSSSSSRRVQFSKINKTGTLSVRVEVQDEDGEISTAISEVHIHWASQFMEYFRKRGVLRGYENGDLKPDQAITRAELTKVILETLKIRKSSSGFQDIFSDVKRNDWFYRYVLTAYEENIVQGYSDGTFRPNQSISRAEALSIIFKAFNFFDVPAKSWFAPYVAKGYQEGIIKGYSDSSFRPHSLLTRGEAAKIVYLASQKFDF